MSMQELDSLAVSPQGENPETATMMPSIRLIRLARTALAPSMINAESYLSTAILREYLGDWSIKSAEAGGTPSLVSTFKVTALGKPQAGIPVTFWLDMEKMGEDVTDQNGLVSFPTEYAEIGVYDYQAVIGERPPLLPVGSPRAMKFRVSVWLMAVFARNLTDVWYRWVGRARWRSLPHIFWVDQPTSVVGLGYPSRDRPIGFVDVIPVVEGTTVPIEIGVSAFCNTPEPDPPPEKCCEYARNTWWDMFICATNDPKQVPDTVLGNANKVGGDKVNLDYHLKYEASSSGITYNGRYLKQQRCPWEAGTAPLDP